MTPLADLLDAVRAGNAVGDDATLRAAWDAEPRLETLLWAMCVAEPVPVLGAAMHGLGIVIEQCPTIVANGARRQGSRKHLKGECPACCDAIRAACACPTRAELTKGSAT